jgi:hypothetical protein
VAHLFGLTFLGLSKRGQVWVYSSITIRSLTSYSGNTFPKSFSISFMKVAHSTYGGLAKRNPPFLERGAIRFAIAPYGLPISDETDRSQFPTGLQERMKIDPYGNQFAFWRMYICISVGLLPIPFCSG